MARAFVQVIREMDAVYLAWEAEEAERKRTESKQGNTEDAR